MAYVDVATLMTIAAGQPLPAAVVQQIRDNDEFLIDPPACSIKESTLQTLTTSATTTLTADEEQYDNDSMHSTSVNTSRITIQTAGRYNVLGSVIFTANATGTRGVSVLVNGATSHYFLQGSAAPSGSTITTGSRTLVLGAGDYIELQVVQTSGGDLTCSMLEFAAMFITR